MYEGFWQKFFGFSWIDVGFSHMFFSELTWVFDTGFFGILIGFWHKFFNFKSKWPPPIPQFPKKIENSPSVHN
jgi:hypothetical protein